MPKREEILSPDRRPNSLLFHTQSRYKLMRIDASAGDGAGVGDGDVDILVGELLSL